MNDNRQNSMMWMQHALKLARRAAREGEVPVGACAWVDGVCVGEGWNQSIQACDPSAHAEIIALRAAAKTLGNYRLTDVTLVVTLEPCLMCIGALQHARIQHLIYGAPDLKQGALSNYAEVVQPSFSVESDVLSQVSAQLLRSFFKARR